MSRSIDCVFDLAVNVFEDTRRRDHLRVMEHIISLFPQVIYRIACAAIFLSKDGDADVSSLVHERSSDHEHIIR